ncbi:hypothetical protein [Halopseudomonas salina]|uniref:Uncharacterized protein n=1 Tax=Halopseudomonas salina TaxID=1323744 RepID=A0ABQ1PD65_9GAMM|nr:hypothetical protein [Halopseudomonas salina]GGC94854.1 hypothetical protein GCM10007418_13050 [Halopseudomonas salina]
MSVGTELMNVPFPMMVRNLGVGIAEAQLELDLVSLRIARMMAGYASGTDEDEDGGSEQTYKVEFSNGKSYSLLELGFMPTFYQFVDTVIELKISISVSSERSSTFKRNQVKASAKGGALPFFAAGSMTASSVSASFASKYQYSAEGSSVMRTKLVTVPPPAILEERIRKMIEEEGEE